MNEDDIIWHESKWVPWENNTEERETHSLVRYGQRKNQDNIAVRVTTLHWGGKRWLFWVRNRGWLMLEHTPKFKREQFDDAKAYAQALVRIEGVY